MQVLVLLAWPLVAVFALAVAGMTLRAWMAGIASERTSLRRDLDALRAVHAQHDFEGMEERLAAAEERLAKLLTVEGADRVLETVNLMVKDVTELKAMVLQLRDRAAIHGAFNQEAA